MLFPPHHFPLHSMLTLSSAKNLLDSRSTTSRVRSHKGNAPTLPQTKFCPLCPAKFTRTTHLNRHLRSRMPFLLNPVFYHDYTMQCRHQREAISLQCKSCLSSYDFPAGLSYFPDVQRRVHKERFTDSAQADVWRPVRALTKSS